MLVKQFITITLLGPQDNNGLILGRHPEIQVSNLKGTVDIFIACEQLRGTDIY